MTSIHPSTCLFIHLAKTTSGGGYGVAVVVPCPRVRCDAASSSTVVMSAVTMRGIYHRFFRDPCLGSGICVSYEYTTYSSVCRALLWTSAYSSIFLLSTIDS